MICLAPLDARSLGGLGYFAPGTISLAFSDQSGLDLLAGEDRAVDLGQISIIVCILGIDYDAAEL